MSILLILAIVAMVIGVIVCYWLSIDYEQEVEREIDDLAYKLYIQEEALKRAKKISKITNYSNEL